MKNHTKRILSVILFLFAFCTVQAQLGLSFKSPGIFQNAKKYSFDNRSIMKKNNNGFYIGVDLGFYKANRYTAAYYNGSDVNSVDSTINYSLNYPKIKEVLLYDFSLAELPSKMHYSPAFLLGLYLKYTMKNSGIFMQFHFSKLRANDVFTLIINDPNNYSSEPVYRQEQISGSEQRATIDLGYSYTFNPESSYRPVLQLGANITTTKYLDNKIRIENLEYSITNYYFSYYNIQQGGVGFGAFAGTGMDLVFNDNISVIPTFNIYYTQAKMGDLAKPKFNYTFYVTAILNGIFSSNSSDE